jgi:hypothetical protein
MGSSAVHGALIGKSLPLELLAMLLGLGDNLNQQELANLLAVTKGNMGS